MRKIASHLVLTPQGLERNRLVVFDDNGTVLGVEECPAPDRMAGVEWYGGVLIPGMVNAHSHLELSYVQGCITPHEGFSGFARGLRASRHLATPEFMRSRAEWWDAKMWCDGVQAVGDVCNDALTFELKSRSRIYYKSFVELYGLAHKDTSAVDAVLDKALEMGLDASITPHSLYLLCDEAYRAACGNERLSIHFDESPEEVELFERRGAMWEWYSSAGFHAPFIDDYASPEERLLALTPSDRQVLLVHACMADVATIKRVEAHFDNKPSWVVCPLSNDFISQLTPPVEALMECASKVAIGTDSLSSNTTLSMVAEMAAMPQVPLEVRMRWATQGGAEALGLEQRLGEFRSGLQSGAVVIEGVDFESMQLTPQSLSRRIL